jgi:hypothetical protein
MCYFRKGAYDEARVVLDEAIQELEDEELRAKILIRRTIIEVWLGKYLQAWEMLKEAQVSLENCSECHQG